MPGYWCNLQTLFKQQLVTYSPAIAMVRDMMAQPIIRIALDAESMYLASSGEISPSIR